MQERKGGREEIEGKYRPEEEENKNIEDEGRRKGDEKDREEKEIQMSIISSFSLSGFILTLFSSFFPSRVI